MNIIDQGVHTILEKGYPLQTHFGFCLQYPPARAVRQAGFDVDFYGFSVWDGLGVRLPKVAKDGVFRYSASSLTASL